MLTFRGAQTPASDPRLGARNGLAAVPGVVWLLILMQTAWMLCVAVVYPPFQAPDEAAHVDYVIAHRHGEWLDGPGQRLVQSGVLKAFLAVPLTASDTHLSVGHRPIPRGQRPSFDTLGTAPSLPAASLPNEMVQHPPLYYGLGAAYTELIPGFGDLGFDMQVFWLRLLSTLLLAPVPLLLFLTARCLLLTPAAALTAAALPLAVPTYLRSGASVSNDAPLVLGGALVALLLAKVLCGDRRLKLAVLMGLAWGAMLLTKGLALLLPPVIVLAYLAGSTGGLVARVRAAVVPTVVVGAVGVVVGGWWWVRNILTYGHVQPNGYGAAYPPSRIYGLNPGATNAVFFHDVRILLVKRVFGSLGLIDNPELPLALVETLFVLLVFGVVVGLLLGLPGARSPRLAGLTMLLPVGLSLAAIIVELHPVYWQTGFFPGIQIRYFLPFLAGLVLPVARALHRVGGRFARWVPALLVTSITVYIFGVMLWYVTVEFGSARGGLAHRLSTGVGYALGWAPWPSAYAVMCASVAVISAVLVVAASVRLGREAATQPEPLAA